MNGLLESIDPYASYLNATQYKEYLKNYDTYRGDLGMVLGEEVRLHHDRIGDTRIAGRQSRADDRRLTRIDQRDRDARHAARLCAAAAEGRTGNHDRTLGLRHKPEPQKITMTRAIVKLVPPLNRSCCPDEIGYIKDPALGEPAGKRNRRRRRALQKQGAKKLILDLRYCATGDPEDGIELANLFLDKGLITYVQGQKYPRKDFNADEKKDVPAATGGADEPGYGGGGRSCRGSPARRQTGEMWANVPMAMLRSGSQSRWTTAARSFFRWRNTIRPRASRFRTTASPRTNR